MMGLPGILISLGGFGQDSTQVTTLREVIVSATRSEQPLIEIPRSVTVINRDVIEKSIYQSLGDLLNTQSGLYIVGANQTPGTNQTAFMRGANGNQVAVLIDGVRITDPSSPNSAIDLSEISLLNIERVEIIRGSHSTMFGGAAIGGVINIITKSNGMRGLHGVAGFQTGMFGKGAFTYTENLDLNYAFKNGFYLNGSVFQQNVKGLDATEKSKPSFTEDKDDFEKRDVFLKAGYHNDQWDGFISFKNSRQCADIDNGAFSDDDNSYLKFDRNLFEYRLGYQATSFLRFSFIGSSGDSDRFYENDSSKIDDNTYDRIYSRGNYHGKLQTHELQINYQKKSLKGVLGAGLYSEEMFFDTYFLYNDPAFVFESATNYDSLDINTKTKYIFGQISHGFGNFNISAGTRASHHTRAGNFITFEINPSYTVNDFLVYGSFSSGFNAPSLYQLYDPSKGYMAYTSRGNADLETEESLSVEAGVKKEFSSGTYFTLSAFQTSVTNSIEFIYLWNGTKSIDELDFSDDRGDTYMNVGKQRVKGFEVETSVVVTDKISLRANITLLKGEIEIKPEDLDGQSTGGNHVQLYNLGSFLTGDIKQTDLVRRPDFSSFMQMRYQPAKDWSLVTRYRYTGSRIDSGYDFTLGPYGALKRLEVEDYHLIDLAINWQATKVLAVAMQVENILNEAYREVAGFQTRGRSGYLKLTARW